MIFKDQLQREFYLKKTPKRIISLVPSQTELLCDLDLKSNIVGVTKFCVHPENIRKEATVVGGTKQIHLDKIKALKPDLILCNKEENTKDLVASCQTVCPVHVSDIFTIDDSLELIKQYGAILNCEQKAKFIINKIEIELRDFNGYMRDQPSLRVAYFIWKEPWMVAGSHTFINHLLQLNGFKNVYSSQKRYPEIALRSADYNNIDLIMLSSEPYPFKEKHKIELQKFYPNAALLLVDGELFSWYGSRLTKAFAYFKMLRSNL